MNIFDNPQIVILNEGSKVIGVKNDDMNRLAEAEAAKSNVSSFSAPQVEAIPVQEQTVIVETPSEDVINDVVSSIDAEQMNSMVNPQESQNVNIFDQAIPGYEPTQMAQAPQDSGTFNQTVIPSYEQSQTIDAPQIDVQTPSFQQSQGVQELTPVFESAPILSEVPLPKDESNNTLDTPQSFFDKTEKSIENNLETQSYESTDTALILLGNLKEVVEGKNRMIQVLTDKVNILENKLSMSEEARKVLEAQKNAAEATLQAAKSAETGGPSLVYQQQNYQQAA